MIKTFFSLELDDSPASSGVIGASSDKWAKLSN